MIAALASWHEHHAAASRALNAIDALPAHVVIEAYSVLTRLPGGLAVPPADAAAVLARRFPARPLRLGNRERTAVLSALAAAGVLGGSTYDGLIALEAAAHGRALLTLDARAGSTYRRLGVEFEPIAT